MVKISEIIKKRFTQVIPIEPGIYHYKTPPYADHQYRMHLRIEPSGEGILILDASTVLHLNQTAAEYAFHIVNGTPSENALKSMANRYDIGVDRLQRDYLDFKERIFDLIDRSDLDPIIYLDLDREAPYTSSTIAPYRVDCAITYDLANPSEQSAAPTKNVERELTTDEWKTILNKCWDAGIPHVIFTGGEPTLRKDLIELIQFAEETGQVTGLLTDGIAFADPSFLDLILQTGLDHLMVVLNPHNDTVWKALEIILPEDLHTTVHLTIFRDDVEEIPAVIKKLSELGVNAISLSSINPELDNVLQRVRELVAELDIPLVWDLPVPYSARNPVNLETIEDDVPDGAGKAWLYIEPDGDVLPAQGINKVLGNLLKDDWKDIWK